MISSCIKFVCLGYIASDNDEIVQLVREKLARFKSSPLSEGILCCVFKVSLYQKGTHRAGGGGKSPSLAKGGRVKRGGVVVTMVP